MNLYAVRHEALVIVKRCSIELT